MKNKLNFLVTGGAGFIGSSVIRHLINETEHNVMNVDKLTYAGNLDSLEEISQSQRYFFSQADICDSKKIQEIFYKYKPDIVMHLAAESHVDRSIEGPAEFINTNILGTYLLLEEAKNYWKSLDGNKKKSFRFHHISTDEVYGDLGNTFDLFKEDTPYSPSSPYSASKASSDHLVRAWSRTFNLPVVLTNCSNNYGPYQFPEKLIPHMILSAISGKPLRVYGNGKQVRDWLYVEDHARALVLVALKSQIGQTYNIGGHNELKNIDVIETICHILEELAPDKPKGVKKYMDLITHVEDRPGHDVRYAIDSSKIKKDLEWEPLENFKSGIRKTIKWYLSNELWWKRVIDGNYSLNRKGNKKI